MKKQIPLILLLSFCLGSYAQTEFITTWQTNLPGVSSGTSITIPTFAGGTYNYDVDWDNDGNYDFVDIGYTGSVTHDFGAPGIYTIRIRGTFPRIVFNDGGDKLKIRSVDQWGNMAWTSMERAFNGCSNLDFTATDAPDLSNVTSMRFMLFNATSFNGDISGWDTSNVTDMSYALANTPLFNQDIGGWNTSNVVNMDRMFLLCASFDQDLSNWDTSNVNNMFGMFNGATNFNGNISTWDTSSVTTMFGMLQFCTSFDQDLGGWNVENVNNFQVMMANGVTLSEANYDSLLIGWNAQNLNSNMTLDAGNSQYCSQAALTARTNMINSDGWIISDGGQFAGTCTLSANDFERQNVVLYPNPTKNDFSIAGLRGVSNIDIFDISGKNILSIPAYLPGEIVSSHGWESGIYIVRIQDQDGISNSKILIE